MTLKELEARVSALEKQVEELRLQLAKQPAEKDSKYWWREQAGRFAYDPIFEEAMRLGREYRESLHPDRRKKKRDKNKK